jgi:hypothetical protein
MLRAGWYRDPFPVEARFSAPVQTGCGAHPASYTKDTAYRKSRAIPLLPLWTCVGCSRQNSAFIFTTSSVDVTVVFLRGVYFTTLFVSETA